MQSQRRTSSAPEPFKKPDDEKRPDDDITKIINFINDIQKDLAKFVEVYDHLVPEYPQLKNDFKAAWKDVEPNFNHMRDYLSSHKDDKEFLRKLSEEGLTKNQLNLKLNVFYLSRTELEKAENEYVDASEDKKDEKRSFWRRAANWLLQNGDTVLGSLSTVGVPGTGGVTEFKEVSEKVVGKLKSIFRR